MKNELTTRVEKPKKLRQDHSYIGTGMGMASAA